MKKVRKLSEMSPGESGVVEKVPGKSAFASRMQEMGLLPGTVIRFVRSGPLGDPLQIELRGYFLSMRRREASMVTVAVS